MIDTKQIRDTLSKISPWPWVCGQAVSDLDETFVLAAPQLISDLCDEIEKLRGLIYDRWKAAAKELGVDVED